MRSTLTHRKWNFIQPIQPSRPRGIARGDDRRIMNGVSCGFRNPVRHGVICRIAMAPAQPPTINRFVRRRRASVLGRIVDGLSAAHDAAVQTIDASVVRVHRHDACIANNHDEHIDRSRAGLSCTIDVVVDAKGLPDPGPT